MKKSISIYLAGSIKKGHESPNESFWTEDDILCLKNQLHTYNVAFLNPAFRSDDLSDQFSVFGRDMTQVFSSTVVLADVRDRRGLGVGAEMMWAKMNSIPVISWAPRNSHYNKDLTTILGVPVENFVHPFVENLSDKIVANLEEAAHYINILSTNAQVPIKGPEHIHQAMKYYQSTQLSHDKPMQELLLSNESLKEKLSK